jgi:hypothetical protein
LHRVIDNLPIGTERIEGGDNSNIFYDTEFPLGSNDESDSEHYVLHNHFLLTIQYNDKDVSEGTYYIVGATVYPSRFLISNGALISILTLFL